MADKREARVPAEQIARLKQLCDDLDVIRKKAGKICEEATEEIRAAHTSSRQRVAANSTPGRKARRPASRKKP